MEPAIPRLAGHAPQQPPRCHPTAWAALCALAAPARATRASLGVLGGLGVRLRRGRVARSADPMAGVKRFPAQPPALPSKSASSLQAPDFEDYAVALQEACAWIGVLAACPGTVATTPVLVLIFSCIVFCRVDGLLVLRCDVQN
ncbi:unnamed protein product [Effrenium voratum]|nr:unnamed protein product [Effrenium voratum]